MNGKPTAKVNLHDLRWKLCGCIVYQLHFYTLWCFLKFQHIALLPTKCLPSCTECHTVGISKVLPSTSIGHPLCFNTGKDNNFSLFSGFSLPLCWLWPKADKFLIFYCLFNTTKNLYCPCLNFSFYYVLFKIEDHNYRLLKYCGLCSRLQWHNDP